MKKIIWKYVADESFVVDKHHDCMILMPCGGRIVHTEVLADGRMVVWVEFLVPNDWDGKEPAMEKNYFRRMPTGGIVPARYQHFHTFISEGGTFVWHLYRFQDGADVYGDL